MSHKPSILIVDDERTNLETLKYTLEEKYDVRVALNGKKALQVLRKHPIDLVLLDIQMPEMDGYEVAEEIVKDEAFKYLPIIFLTSKNDHDSIVRGFTAGAVDYVTKPFNIEELKVRINNHIEKHLMQVQIIKQQKFLEELLDSQTTMIVQTDGKMLRFTNHRTLDFYALDSVNSFQERYECICNTFLEKSGFFHLGLVQEGYNWLDELGKRDPDARIVAIKDKKGNDAYFNINIRPMGYENLYMLELTDNTQSIMKQKNLEEKALVDTLTKAYNRDFFYNNIQTIILKNSEKALKTAIAMVDIDYFKHVNDTYGHDVGDKVLQDIVRTIKYFSREQDFVIRWGGEEFVLIKAVADIQAFHKALENLRVIISEHEYSNVGHITCSFGGTLSIEEEDINHALKRADEALYRSKNSGRNKVMTD